MVSISYVDLCCLVHQTQFFPIWTLTTSSPSVTGFYRMKQTFRRALSKIFDLRYCTCIFNILLSYEIMSVLTLHLTFCAAVSLVPFILWQWYNSKVLDRRLYGVGQHFTFCRFLEKENSCDFRKCFTKGFFLTEYKEFRNFRFDGKFSIFTDSRS